MILVLRGGHVYAPRPSGPASVLVLGDRIAAVGEVDHDAAERLGVPIDVLDATDALVVPGLIDPHVHLIGGSGERGYGSWTPEIVLRELVVAGVTTVVGCLGVDTTMKTMATLIGKAKGLRAEGLTALAYSGGYQVPPATLLGSVRNDMILVEEVIGAGEVAIADVRGTQPSAAALAALVADAYVGGLLTGKAGVTHIHVGDAPAGLALVREVLARFDIVARCVYPTHVERTQPLLREAADLSTRGVFVDIDTVGDDLQESLETFVEAGGDLAHLTVSSDASITAPRQRLDQIRHCARSAAWPLERLLPLVTGNVATVLALPHKGRIEPGADADLVVFERTTLALRHVIAAGHVLLRDGVVVARERYQEQSPRRIRLDGDQD